MKELARALLALAKPPTRGKEAGKSAFSPHQKPELIALSKGIFLSNLG